MRLVLRPAAAFTLIFFLMLLSGLAVYVTMRNHSATSAAHTSHLIAQWNFDEGSGGSSADASGHGNTATLAGGATWSQGLVGAHALHLVGESGSFAEVARPLVDTTRSYTVTACVKLHQLSGFQTIVSVDGDKVSGFFLQLRDDSHTFAFAVLPHDDSNQNNPALATANDAPEADRWYHLAGVYDAAAHTLSLYIDGVLQQTTPITGTWAATGHTVIGRGKYNSNPVDGVNGEIDDVRFYDEAKSAADILEIAKADIPTAGSASADANAPATLQIQADKATTTVSPMHYGMMTEEINHSYDGGLYAELLQNRVFADRADEPIHWSLVEEGGGKGSFALDKAQPLSRALPTSLKVTVTGASGSQRVGASNDGYWGVPVKPDTAYRASFYARAAAGFSGPLTVSLESGDGSTKFVQTTVPAISDSWKQYTVTLKTGSLTATPSGRFVISASKPGAFWLNLVSLFPPTYHNRLNGNRPDLMELMAAMKPSFLRMPGGNYLEGNKIEERFAWKTTLHDLTQRSGHPCPWGYRSSDGMGLLEFLEWCEDLKIQPVLAVFAGYALQGEHIEPGPALKPHVQDALDEIEYVTGGPSTKWGAVRVKDGHPAPFPLTYVEIGNEDWFDKSGSYDGRYAQFYDAIKAKYPKLQLIASAGVKSRTPDVIDEHYYRDARAMRADKGHYDNYNRKGPKIFVGEWASQEGKPTPNLSSAIGDAAWMTGMERNSDIVVMQCYAPLFVNVNPGGSQWGTNLIGYDGLTSYGSPSYYAQQMFGQYHGDKIVPVEQDGGKQLAQSVTRDSKTGMLTVKLVNAGSSAQAVHLHLTGVASVGPTGTAITLSGKDPSETNTLTDPKHLVPVTSTVNDLKPEFDYTLPPYSVVVLQIPSK